MKALFLAMLIAALALACAAPVPTPIPTATPDIPATVTARIAALPTATPYPTLTPWPTATPRPTVTPYPTPTAVPTATPYPTSTPYPTPTALPTYTPYPTATPDIRYQVVTPTPEPTPGPLADWVTHSSYDVSISMPLGFIPGYSNMDTDGYFTLEYEATGQVAGAAVVGLPYDSTSRLDLYGTADWMLEYISQNYTAGEVLSFQKINTNALLALYRVYHNTGRYCNGTYKVLFTQVDGGYTYAAYVFWCDHVRWKYGEDFADRVLNSFTY